MDCAKAPEPDQPGRHRPKPTTRANALMHILTSGGCNLRLLQWRGLRRQRFRRPSASPASFVRAITNQREHEFVYSEDAGVALHEKSPGRGTRIREPDPARGLVATAVASYTGVVREPGLNRAPSPALARLLRKLWRYLG